MDRLPIISPYLRLLFEDVLLRKRWKTKELAEKAGLSYNFVRRVVNGTIVPKRKALMALCVACDLDFATVWEKARTEKRSETDLVVERFMETLKQLPSDERERLLQRMDAMRNALRMPTSTEHPALKKSKR